MTVAAGERGERTEHVEAIFLDTRSGQLEVVLEYIREESTHVVKSSGG